MCHLFWSHHRNTCISEDACVWWHVTQNSHFPANVLCYFLIPDYAMGTTVSCENGNSSGIKWWAYLMDSPWGAASTNCRDGKISYKTKKVTPFISPCIWHSVKVLLGRLYPSSHCMLPFTYTKSEWSCLAAFGMSICYCIMHDSREKLTSVYKHPSHHECIKEAWQ